jgi:hypothetical protein
MTGSSMENSYATGNVDGDDNVGGLVGSMTGSSMENSYATGDVNGDENVGGLAGSMTGSGRATATYATGAVTGRNYVGGLVGRITGSNNTIASGFVDGAVTGTNDANAVVGGGASVSITNSFRYENMPVNDEPVLDNMPSSYNGGILTRDELTTRATWSERGWTFTPAGPWIWNASEFPTLENYEAPAPTTAPEITTTTLSSGRVGTAYSAILAATGDTPVTWTLDSGSLPIGLVLSQAGVISGTPSAEGTSDFTVRATNSAGSDTQELSIVIAAVIEQPNPPEIITAMLPQGRAGTFYSATLVAAGSTPVTWTLAGGNLPAGLVLAHTGFISGTPVAAGTSSFTVRATNSVGNDTKPLSIVIAAAIEQPAPEMPGHNYRYDDDWSWGGCNVLSGLLLPVAMFLLTPLFFKKRKI